MHVELDGSTALVTGGARRIGRGIAARLAEEGAEVVIHFNGSAEEASSLVEELRSRGHRATTVRGDLSDPSSVDGIVDGLSSAGVESLDVLVNNASSFTPGSPSDVEAGSIVRALWVNALSPHLLAVRLAGEMGLRKVVNVLDAAPERSAASRFPYYLGKRLLEAATYSLAIHLAPKVAVNAVALGPILPPSSSGGRSAGFEGAIASTPLGRAGTIDEVADAVVFLLRDDYVTGQVIYVDGGMHLLGVGGGLG